IGDKDIYDPIVVRREICNDIRKFGSEQLERTARASYIRICISIYDLTQREEGKEYVGFGADVRRYIIDEKAYIKYLNIGGRIRADMIRFCPSLYNLLIRK
ncbi:MAG: hypothetical protein IKN38_08280, partial [Clostridia bacterium]|nr:hypothetical protein [Clostridia bacterium]